MGKKSEVVNVKEVIASLVEEGKSRYAIIKHLGELEVPVAEIARAGAEYGISYHYAYNVLKQAGKIVTKPRTENKSAKMRDLLKEGMKPMQIAKELGVRPQFVYNVRRRMIDRGELVIEDNK